MRIDALIFDFDGLIIDTETPDFTVLAAIYAAHGATLTPAMWERGLGTIGNYDPLAELQQIVGRELALETLRAEQSQRMLELVERQPLLPGVQTWLDFGRQQRLPMAIASSSSRRWVTSHIERHAITDYFTCIRTRTDGYPPKPAPDLFLAAAAGLGVAPAHCLVFEDSLNGMRAARTAGMRVVAVPLAVLGAIELPPHDLRLTTLADLPPHEVLQRLEATT
jgi:HAD superfamily hydrolase (TIGR01509 family)